MSGVRPFVKADIAQVAELHRTVFATADGPSARDAGCREAYLGEVFLDNPWRDEALSSLVYEEAGGRISGFLGVMPRSMRMHGAPVRAAVASQFIVHPERRGRLGLRLLKALFDGPQDLSMTDEANDSTRVVWEGLHGTTAFLYSMRWTFPLRPGRLALSVLRGRKWAAPLALVSGPFALTADAVLARLARTHFGRSLREASDEDLDAATLLTCLDEFSGDRALSPQYGGLSLRWVLRRAGGANGDGRLHKVLVRRQTQEVAGWYIYYVDSRRVGEVLQIVAKPYSVDEVLDHLFSHASARGVVALSGRLEPRLIRALSRHNCLFHWRGPWMLVHSKRAELLDAIHRGDAFLTRLEGEWCMRYRLG